jgi:hypothetical protein
MSHKLQECQKFHNDSHLFMDGRVLIPFGKLTRFFTLFPVVRLPLGDEFLRK